MSVDALRQRKTPKFVFWFASSLALALLMIAGWTVFWHFATRESERILDAWIAREKAVGRNWSCPHREVAGYPFAIDISCAEPRFNGLIFGKHYAGGLNGFHATALLMRPTQVTARIVPPFAAQSDDHKVDLNISWANLNVTLGGLPKGHVVVNGDGFTLRGTFENLGLTTGKVAQVMADAAERPDQSDRAYDFYVVLDGASLPLLDQVLGPKSLANISVRGTLTQASFDPGHTMPENFERWRKAGGHLDIADATITNGETKFNAHGRLTLDDAHLIAGKLDTESQGLEPLLRRLGVDPVLINAGSLLSSILGGSSSGDQQAQTLRVPVAFGGGHLYIGPVRTSIKPPPLY